MIEYRWISPIPKADLISNHPKPVGFRIIGMDFGRKDTSVIAYIGVDANGELEIKRIDQ